MADTSFRSYPTATGQIYEIDGVPVSKSEFDTRVAVSKQNAQSQAIANRGEIESARSGMSDDMDADATDAFKRLRAMKKKSGGNIKLSASKISTHQKSKKSPSW
jgi:hypothetical protein